MRRPGRWAVHFAGDQEVKWALDEDLRWARQALDGDVAADFDLAKPHRARGMVAKRMAAWRRRIARAGRWSALSTMRLLSTRGNPSFMPSARSSTSGSRVQRQAVREFAVLGIHAELRTLLRGPEDILTDCHGTTPICRPCDARLGLPEDAYVIGNFHSDTAFTIGPDRPKWQKGPDVFAEIVRRLREVEPRVCVLLAGPRRHWLRQRLRALDVPVFFVGREVAEDDFASNILDRTALNRLYNLLDLYLVCSRWEGGPHSILEACFSKTKVMSTRVGIAEDILESNSLFDTIPEAVTQILEDIRHGTLQSSSQSQYERVVAENSPKRLSDALRQIYQSFPRETRKGVLAATAAWIRSHGRGAFRRRYSPPKTVGMISGGTPGRLFEFLHGAMRQSGAFDICEKTDARCRHYLVDESWLRTNDPKKMANRRVVLVCDSLKEEPPLPASAIVVPSFKTLSERPRKVSGPRPLVIPPVLDGTNFDASIPIREQLTSTVNGVAQAIRQLFAVLDSPEDARWLGFR